MELVDPVELVVVWEVEELVVAESCRAPDGEDAGHREGGQHRPADEARAHLSGSADRPVAFGWSVVSLGHGSTVRAASVSPLCPG